MPILSERKGVNNWLNKKGVKSIRFIDYIIKCSPCKFYRVTYKPTKQTQKNFQEFVKWYNTQNIEELRKSYVKSNS